MMVQKGELGMGELGAEAPHMSSRARAYIGGVLLLGTMLAGWALFVSTPSTFQWSTFAALTALAILTQLLKILWPNQNLGQAKLVFLFAGVFLLPPSLFVMLVIIPHVTEWARARLVKTSGLRNWYIQPFNIATHIIAGSAAYWISGVLRATMTTFLAPISLFAAIAAILVYVALNDLLIATVFVLAQNISWQESGILDVESLLSDAVLLCLGYILAVLWKIVPWLLPLALAPLMLIWRALTIPQLKKDAQTDTKTGLLNARYFSRSLASELQRARRLEQPLSVIMADLDLLRTVNNTYGHLAGDAALAAVGRIIRDTVGSYGIAGRFGGEEFSIVLPKMTATEARSLAERMREAVASDSIVVSTNPMPIHVTMSLGVASFPIDAVTSKDLIHEADVAVYQAKLRGRNCVICSSDVPRSVRLEAILSDGRPESAFTDAFVHGSEIEKAHPATDTSEPRGKASVPAEEKAQPDTATPSLGYPALWVWLLVAGVITAGAVAVVLGFALDPPSEWMVIGLLAFLALIAEYYQIDLYGDGSVSVSVAILFAAALIMGLSGVVIANTAIAAVHYLRRRPPLYKTVFSWATHVLAALAPVMMIRAQAISLTAPNLPLLSLLTAIAALAYFGIESGLIATAIGLSTQRSPVATWREEYRWLVSHYLVLCFMGMFLGIAYRALGAVGIVVFTFPIIMMRYAQKQYVDRTEEGMQELKRLNQELTSANREVVGASRAIRHLNDELFMALARVIDARDPFAAGHAATAADYAAAIAARLGLKAERLDNVRQAALLHDIGKLGIPESILLKPGRLTDAEYASIKTHAALGGEFLEACQGLRHLAPFVAHHHERWDGRGYPDGLQGDEIPLEARILAVCDAVEAMASDRPYHRAMSLDEVITEVRLGAGTQFDPAVAEEFVSIVQQKGEHYVTNSAQEVSKHQTVRQDGTYDSAPWFVLQTDDIDIRAVQ